MLPVLHYWTSTVHGGMIQFTCLGFVPAFLSTIQISPPLVPTVSLPPSLPHNTASQSQGRKVHQAHIFIMPITTEYEQTICKRVKRIIYRLMILVEHKCAKWLDGQSTDKKLGKKHPLQRVLLKIVQWLGSSFLPVRIWHVGFSENWHKGVHLSDTESKTRQAISPWLTLNTPVHLSH